MSFAKIALLALAPALFACETSPDRSVDTTRTIVTPDGPVTVTNTPTPLPGNNDSDQIVRSGPVDTPEPSKPTQSELEIIAKCERNLKNKKYDHFIGQNYKDVKYPEDVDYKLHQDGYVTTMEASAGRLIVSADENGVIDGLSCEQA